VDTLGLVLQVVIHPANLGDREGGRLVIEALKGRFPRLQKIWADQGYTGTFAQWVEETLAVKFEVVYPWWRQIKRYFPELYQPIKQDFHVIAKRWIVERTFAWLTFQRRLVKDYEYLAQTSENLIYLAMIRLMLRRLAS
jgi:putative transposase